MVIWCGATLIAVSVSWFGVRGVLRTEFVDDVQVEPYRARAVADGERGTPSAAPVRTPAPTPTLTPAPVSTSAKKPTRTPASTPVRTPTKKPVRTPVRTPASTPARTSEPAATSARPTPAQASENLRVVTVKGGEVTFELGPDGCRLISAIPNSGYSTNVSSNTGWIRVDLAKGEHGSSAFCISGERRTDTWEY